MAGAEDPASPVRDVALAAPCPMCGAANLRMRSLSIDIPYFGEALQTTVVCEACGFRHADVLLAREGPPTRHVLRVTRPSDLTARIVRSSSGTIRIPEIGGLLEPGLRSEGFVSNAEGVLHRFRDILGFLSRNADSPAARRRAEASRATLDRMIEGEAPFTIILDDPFGNSAILHDTAEVRPLTDEEVRGLKTGVFTVELRRGTPRAPASP
ncbi:MAG TPA: ZPR1 zinc finger domain-containing protein [Thermoplasmata archaeon]|nr:ZPR1 zinc finger domain-containing protein [Thermoplasmata archaeon]